jgi:hypothetical protein
MARGMPSPSPIPICTEILYLHDNPGRVFCRTCLARLAQAEQWSLVGRVAEIAGKTQVEGMGRCSECGEYTQVLGVQP